MAHPSPLQDRIAFYNPRTARLFRRSAGILPDDDCRDLPDETPGRARALLQEWLSEFPPAHIGDRALVEQVVVASLDQQRAQQARTAVLAQQVRTAELSFDQEQERQVQELVALLPSDPMKGLAGLNRTAAGTRYQIARWERLETILLEAQTWFGADRDEAIMLQGARPGIDHLAESEAAFVTWFYCVNSDPAQNEHALKQSVQYERRPGAFQDNPPLEWIPFAWHSQALLKEMVARQLAPLRQREEWLRLHVEEPARAAARAAARVLRGADRALLSAERQAEQSFRQAYQALIKQHPGRPDPRPDRTATPAPVAPAQPARLPGRLEVAPPAVFFDYQLANRAAREEIEESIEYYI